MEVEKEDAAVLEKGEEPVMSEEEMFQEENSTVERRARLNRGLFRGIIVPRTVRSGLLFAFGVVYGIIALHLHENHWITPVRLGKVQRHSWQYLAYWGLGGVAIGNVLPWLDTSTSFPGWRRHVLGRAIEKKSLLSWDAAVRSVGAFVGIAFALVSIPFFRFLFFRLL